MTDLFIRRVPWPKGAAAFFGRGLACLLTGFGVLTTAHAGNPAWMQDHVSAGLSPQRPEVLVQYQPGARDPVIAPGSRIVRVHARRDWAGAAVVETRLCHGSAEGPCVPIRGTQLNTHRFDGLPASGPFVMIHRVAGWAQALPPLFVSGTVTVWFDRP